LTGSWLLPTVQPRTNITSRVTVYDFPPTRLSSTTTNASAMHCGDYGAKVHSLIHEWIQNSRTEYAHGSEVQTYNRTKRLLVCLSVCLSVTSRCSIATDSTDFTDCLAILLNISFLLFSLSILRFLAVGSMRQIKLTIVSF